MAFVVLVFKRDFDGYKNGNQYSVEKSLGERYIENQVAVPLSVHLDQQAEKKEAAKRADEAKAEADEAKKAELLKKKEEAEIEKADSKQAKRRSKEVKK